MVTEMDFQNYVEVQYSGMFNMITQANEVMNFAGLEKDIYTKIIMTYDDLVKRYPKAFENGQLLGKEMRKNIYG